MMAELLAKVVLSGVFLVAAHASADITAEPVLWAVLGYWLREGERQAARGVVVHRAGNGHHRPDEPRDRER